MYCFIRFSQSDEDEFAKYKHEQVTQNVNEGEDFTEFQVGDLYVNFK